MLLIRFEAIGSSFLCALLFFSSLIFMSFFFFFLPLEEFLSLYSYHSVDFFLFQELLLNIFSFYIISCSNLLDATPP